MSCGERRRKNFIGSKREASYAAALMRVSLPTLDASREKLRLPISQPLPLSALKLRHGKES